MFDGEALHHVAIAPKGYVHLEQAVYRLAISTDREIWSADPSVLPWYERLGTGLHLAEIGSQDRAAWLGSDALPRFQARLDSLGRAAHQLRLLLRQQKLAAIHQRWSDGKEASVPAHRWAQHDAATWFARGQVIIDGLLSDLFVEESALNVFTGGSTDEADLTTNNVEHAHQGRSKSVLTLIVEQLHQLHPHGRPVGINQKRLLAEVEKVLGFKVGLRSVTRAISVAWPKSKPNDAK